MKSLFSVLGIVGLVLAVASGCSDDDFVVDPVPPPSGDAGSEPTADAGADAGELLDADTPGTVPDASPVGDAEAPDAESDAGPVSDADVDAGDAQ